MANFAYAAGHIRYISVNNTSFLMECDNTMICARYYDIGEYRIGDAIIISGHLKNTAIINVHAIEKVDSVDPINILVFDGHIGKGKGHPMLVSVGKDIIYPEDIYSQPPKNTSKLDNKKKRRIIACFTDSRIKLLKAIEV